MKLKEKELQIINEVVVMMFEEINKYIPFSSSVINLIKVDLNKQLIKKYGIKIV
jgi:hypothetical protein